MRHKRAATRSIGVDMDLRVINQWMTQHPSYCELVHDDATKFLATYAFAGTEVVYADPPYVPSTRRRSRVYRYDCNDKQHEALLDVLAKLPCAVLISGYDNDLYRDVLHDWRIERFLAKTHTGLREEVVWTNFAPPRRLHDASFWGNTFRDREGRKRRQTRWLSKFDSMCPIERNQLLELLATRYPSETNV